MAETAGRVATGAMTGGLSEVARPFMKNAFKTPTPPGAIPPATTQTKAVQQVAAEGAQRRSKARGYLSTILSQNTSGQGLNQTFGS